MKNYWLKKRKHNFPNDDQADFIDLIGFNSLDIYYTTQYVHKIAPEWFQDEAKLEPNVVPFSVVIKHCGKLCVDDGNRLIKNENGKLIAMIIYESGLLMRLYPNAEFVVSYEHSYTEVG